MADYFPPSETLPTFDVSVFRSTNDNVITQEEADRLYLHRNGTASSLATSTSFLGPITTTGNLTLNGAIASNRQVEASYLKLVDNASATINKPLIWYPDPSLQITTNDFTSGTLRTIDLKSYDGTGTGTYSQFSCQYNRVTAQGNIRLTRLNDAARYSNFTMGATELTIENTHSGATPHINLNTPTAGTGNIITNSPVQLTNKTDPTKSSTLTQGASNLTIANSVASGNILLNTTTGAIVANTPIVPSDIVPAIFSSRPSIGYNYYGSRTNEPITSTAPINYLTSISIPIGTWIFEASVTCAKSTSTFATTSPLSSTRLSYANATGLVFVGVNNGFENAFANDQYTGLSLCGCVGVSRIVTITTAQQIPLTIQANWATIGGSPTYNIYWSIIRIA